MKHVAVVGLGKVGSLVAAFLSEQFTVTGIDQISPANLEDLRLIQGDVSNKTFMRNALKDQEAVVSCLPFSLNLTIAEVAYELGIHYFDLTEDVPTTQAIRKMAADSKGAMVPQCGLAPGFIGIVGADLYKRFTKLRDVELRVGALPKYPNGQLAYSFTWSPAGVINEYINDAEVIHNGVKKMVPSLSGLEKINIEGRDFEAFYTSGGLGTMCETLEGKVDTLNYKTIRYPGHCNLMTFFLYELLMKDDRQTTEKILTSAKPPVQEDVVYVYAVVEGWQGEYLAREEFYKAYSPIQVNGKHWRAISWTTAASVAAVVELVSMGKLPQKGFVKQEDIALSDFLNTPHGKIYAENH